MSSARFESEKVVVSAPMSFAGSTQRIWRMTEVGSSAAKAALIPLAVILLVLAWSIILCWYCIFGLLLVPYRLLRRGSRKRKVAALQHREQLSALANMQQQQQMQTSLLMSQQTANMQQQAYYPQAPALAPVPPPHPAPPASAGQATQ